MSTATLTLTPTSRSVRRAGAWCLGGGLLGAAQGLAVVAWSPQVPDDRFNYPFDGPWYTFFQTSFFVQHLPLLVGVAALLRLSTVRASRAARISIGAAVVGLGLLAVIELVAISAYGEPIDSSYATLVESLYGPPVTLIGAGLLVAGLAMRRRGAPTAGAPWLPWAVIAVGGYVFLPLTPTLVVGTPTAIHLAITGWMLAFAVLGHGLTRLENRDV